MGLIFRGKRARKLAVFAGGRNGWGESFQGEIEAVFELVVVIRDFLFREIPDNAVIKVP